jgi:hypothetical protein
VIELSLGCFDRVLSAFAQIVVAPVVHRHADDRAVQHGPGLKPVQRLKRHHLGQVTGDAEDDHHVRVVVV